MGGQGVAGPPDRLETDQASDSGTDVYFLGCQAMTAHLLPGANLIDGAVLRPSEVPCG